MGISTAIVRELMLAGLEGEALLAALERIEAASAPALTKRQERDRRYYEAHREQKIASVKARQAAVKTEATENDGNVGNDGKATENDGNAGGEKMSPKNNNQTPKTPSSFANASEEGDAPAGADPIPPKAKSSDWPANAFEQFWAIYPNRANRKKAAETLRRVQVSGKTPWASIVAGVENLKRHTDPQFYPHATTWLNGERWNDEFAPASGAPNVQQGNRNHRANPVRQPEQSFSDKIAAAMGRGTSVLHGSQAEVGGLYDGAGRPDYRHDPRTIDAVANPAPDDCAPRLRIVGHGGPGSGF